MTFEARLEINRNGAGAAIFAFAYPYNQSREEGRYLQDILW